MNAQKAPLLAMALNRAWANATHYKSVHDGPDIDDPFMLGQKQYEADLRFTTLCGKITDNIVA
jgi:hypothetical protein